MKEKQLRNQRGITLVALVVTIIVLIVLAGIAISMTVGDNGIFTKAKEAKRLQITSEAKEKIGAEILDAQVEAVQKNETLQQSKVEEIIAKYGELQADGDTIKLKDNGYEISLKEIYNGTTSSSGGSTGGSTDSAELDSLKAELAQTNATEDKILKDYKAYSNGKLMTGTMENYAGITQEVEATSDDTYTYLSIPNNGYYTTASKLKTINSNTIDIGYFFSSYSYSVQDNFSNHTVPMEVVSSKFTNGLSIEDGSIRVKNGGIYRIAANLNRHGNYTSMGILVNGTLTAGRNYVDTSRTNIGFVYQDISVPANALITMSMGGTSWSSDSLGCYAGSYMYIVRVV